MAYVYRHIRLDKNEPFYIGIGSDPVFKRAKERARRSSFWKKIIAKTDYKIEIIFDGIDYDYAKKKEIEFISMYGRLDLKTGTLVNLTSGGDGINDRIFTDLHKDKLSLAAKNRYKNRIIKNKLSINEQSKLCSERMKIKNPSKGLTKNLSASFKGNVFVYSNNFLMGEYLGVIDAAEKLNLCKSKISACLVGKRKSHKGFTFKR